MYLFLHQSINHVPFQHGRLAAVDLQHSVRSTHLLMISFLLCYRLHLDYLPLIFPEVWFLCVMSVNVAKIFHLSLYLFQQLSSFKSCLHYTWIKGSHSIMCLIILALWWVMVDTVIGYILAQLVFGSHSHSRDLFHIWSVSSCSHCYHLH